MKQQLLTPSYPCWVQAWLQAGFSRNSLICVLTLLVLLAKLLTPHSLKLT